MRVSICPTCGSPVPLVDLAAAGGRCPDPWHDANRPATAMNRVRGLQPTATILDDPIQEELGWHGEDPRWADLLRADRANPAEGVSVAHGPGTTADDTPRRLPATPAPFHGLSIRAVRAIPMMMAVWIRRTRDGRPRRRRS